MSRMRGASWIVLILGIAALSPAEVVYLNNGDVLHGELVAANNTVITLETPYGKLIIPKKDIQRIDYEGASVTGTEVSGDVRPGAAPVTHERRVISLHLSGRSFWYAFESASDNATDTRIRLRIYIGSAPACTFEDEKADTVDGGTLYNSFTFSPNRRTAHRDSGWLPVLRSRSRGGRRVAPSRFAGLDELGPTNRPDALRSQ